MFPYLLEQDFLLRVYAETLQRRYEKDEKSKQEREHIKKLQGIVDDLKSKLMQANAQYEQSRLNNHF